MCSQTDDVYALVIWYLLTVGSWTIINILKFMQVCAFTIMRLRSARLIRCTDFYTAIILKSMKYSIRKHACICYWIVNLQILLTWPSSTAEEGMYSFPSAAWSEDCSFFRELTWRVSSWLSSCLSSPSSCGESVKQWQKSYLCNNKKNTNISTKYLQRQLSKTQKKERLKLVKLLIAEIWILKLVSSIKATKF